MVIIPKKIKSSSNTNNNKMKKEKKINETISINQFSTTNNKMVNVIAQEVKFVKLLAGNDPRAIEKHLRSLKKWLHIRSQSSFAPHEENFLRLWKGLFYSMWMSDKPLIQEKLAEDIASIVNCFCNPHMSITFFGAFLKTMNLEWYGIDQWRMDKFMMLVRRCSRQIFIVLQKELWSTSLIFNFQNEILNSIFNSTSSTGLSMHFTEIYIEEIAKITEGNISDAIVFELIKPFATVLVQQHDKKIIHHIVKHIFNNLLLQSDRGREYKEKFDVWKSLGFPGKSLDDLEAVDLQDEIHEDKNELDDNTGKEKFLDPRAGRIDIIIPEIPFNAEQIIKFLEELKYKDNTNVTSRKILTNIIKHYTIYANGDFPFSKMATKINDEDIELPSIDDKVKDFIKFENKLYGGVRLLKKMNKKKRKKVLHMVNSDQNQDNNEQIPSNYKKKKLINWKETELTENIDLYSNLLSNNNKAKFNVSTEISMKSNGMKNKYKKRQKNESMERINEIDQNETAATESKNIASTLKADIENVTSNIRDNQNENNTLLNKETNNLPLFHISEEWSKPLEVGEIEYYVPSKKVQVEQANKIFKEICSIKNQNDDNKLLLNPFAIQSNSNKKSLIRAKNRRLSTPVIKSKKSTEVSSPLTSSEKRVKFMLQLNKVQDTNEYIRQLRSSPQLPYDSKKVPAKGVLKPNLMPSPINPFYRRNIGLHLNDTF